jgi:hypothetical protein
MKECQINKHEGCCCICKFRVEISNHPWNEHEAIQGDTNTRAFWGCGVEFAEYIEGQRGAYPVVMASDREHGMCEMFIVKPKIKKALSHY